MANTYSQLNVHCIFAVKGRKNQLHEAFREDLFKYMTGVFKNHDVFTLAIGGYVDHVHVFFELPVNKTVSDLMRLIKANSSRWINRNKLTLGQFQWQSGYGAFSHAKSTRSRVINYIINQEEHHRGKSFKRELLQLYKRYEIEYDDRFLFEFY